MAKHKIIASFSNGAKVTRTTDNIYVAAWGIFGENGKLLIAGFSRTKEGAKTNLGNQLSRLSKLYIEKNVVETLVTDQIE